MAIQHSQYLESKVLTAPPHRLHLMLIEGAIRFSRQAKWELANGNRSAAAGPMMRVLDIVGELLAGIRQNKGELNDKLAAVYWFIFRRVSEATMYSDMTALMEVLRLLEFERETWQQVCEKLGSNQGAPKLLPLDRARSSSPTGISIHV